MEAILGVLPGGYRNTLKKSESTSIKYCVLRRLAYTYYKRVNQAFTSDSACLLPLRAVKHSINNQFPNI